MFFFLESNILNWIDFILKYFFIQFIFKIDNRGHVKARFDFGSGVGFLVIDDRKVNDGGWHHIHVERYGKYVAMVLDKKDILKKESNAPGDSVKININGHGIQIGAGLSHDGMIFSNKFLMLTPEIQKIKIIAKFWREKIKITITIKVQPSCSAFRCI